MPTVIENENNHNGTTSDLKVPIDAIPRLVVASGQTIEVVDELLANVEKQKIDNDYLETINQAHTKNIPLHNYRGYSVVGDMEPIQQIAECSDDNRAIWFIFPGTSTECLSAAKDLMHLDVFRNTINRCADILRPKGIDLLYILTENDETIFDNFIHIEVAIVSMQIAFIDLLTHLGIVPDGIIGFSLGEFSAAYADGCATLEQTILAAYWVGHSILNSEVITSTLIVVGLSLEEILARIRSDVYVAGNFAKDKVLICGRPEPVAKFTEKLNNEGIYTKEIDLGLPLGVHSKLMAEPASKLKKSLEQIYLSPKNRTSRWISTCFQESEWSLPEAQQCSAAYFNHNVLKPMLFYEAMQHVPKNAICIGIAPNGVFRNFTLTKVAGPDIIVLGLNDHVHENNFVSVLNTIGKLYVAGAQPAVLKLNHSVSSTIDC